MSDELQNRRRSQRVLLQIGVIIKAEMPEGTRLQALAFTQIVNAHGGLLGAPFKMIAGQRVVLVNPKSGREAGCRILRVDEPTGGCFPTAFEFDERSPHFWPISFPPADWGVGQAVPVEKQ